MSVGISFGYWVRQRRKELGIPQQDLADQVGCSLVTLQKIESGKRKPSRQIALLLADRLMVPVDERAAFVTFARTSQGSTGSAGDEAGEHAPWRAARLRHTNLPDLLDPLIGREQELATLSALLTQPRARLVTLAGPPGIGKTRLALEVASTLADQFEDGAFLVDLAPIIHPELVIPAIAHTLDLREMGGETMSSVLNKYLGNKRLLLLLDNFEQVLDAAPAVVALLQASPWVKMLITSREALHVHGERHFAVPPLELPELEHTTTPAALARNPCVQLLVEQAKAINPHFSLTADNVEDIAYICVNLDGLPLALGLAAGGVALSPKQARRALSNRLALLKTGARDLPPRQRTLRKAIEWSYDLLSSKEQTLFRRLGVFVAGFSASAAEAISSMARSSEASRLADDYLPLAEGLSSLLHKNLLRHEDGTDGEARLRMLETIREFAEERLVESGEVSAIRRMHAQYYLGLAEAAQKELNGPDQVTWLGKLERDHDNLRVVLNWALERADDPSEAQEKLDIGSRLGGAMWRFWLLHGYFSEGRGRLEAILAASAASAGSLGVDGAGTGDRITAAKAWVLHGIARLAYAQRDNAASRSYGRESLDLFNRLGEKKGMAAALVNLALLETADGNYASSRALHEEGLDISREAGDRPSIANSLVNLGFVRYQQGDYDAARTLHEEGIAVQRELGDKIGMAMSLSNLGSIAWLQGDYAAASALHQESLAIQRESGHALGVAYSLMNLGHAVQWLGDVERAKELYTQSLRLGHKIGLSYCIAACLTAIGGLTAKQGQAAKGARLLGAAEALLEAIGGAWEVDDRIISVEGAGIARTQLGEPAFETAWAEGQGMTLEEAVTYAQQDPNFPPRMPP